MAPQNPIDAYLAGLAPDKRVAFQRLRKTIRAAVPKAEECISYGIPAFRLKGKFLVGVAGAANHCSFYPGAVLVTLGQDLRHNDTSKGLIRFQHRSPFFGIQLRWADA